MNSSLIIEEFEITLSWIEVLLNAMAELQADLLDGNYWSIYLFAHTLNY